MNATTTIRMIKRAEINQKADRFYELEFETSRQTMGSVAASQHARDLAESYKAREYDRIERELED